METSPPPTKASSSKASSSKDPAPLTVDPQAIRAGLEKSCAAKAMTSKSQGHLLARGTQAYDDLMSGRLSWRETSE